MFEERRDMLEKSDENILIVFLDREIIINGIIYPALENSEWLDRYGITPENLERTDPWAIVQALLDQPTSVRTLMNIQLTYASSEKPTNALTILR